MSALLLALAATALPLLDVFSDPCSGSGDSAPGSMVGQCFAGGAKVLTISEQAILKIQSFDAATGVGTLNLDAEGITTVHCPPASFTKVAGERNINVDLAACGKIHKTLASAEYCSDQNTIRIHVKVPDSAAPGASNLPLVPVTLKPTACKGAHAELKMSKDKP